MVGDHSRQMKTQICTVGDVGVLRRWISLITNSLNCWAPVPLSQINVSFLENLGQTSGEYSIFRQSLGWSAKSKTPDRLRFSGHMKTRLKGGVRQGSELGPILSTVVTNKMPSDWPLRIKRANDTSRESSEHCFIRCPLFFSSSNTKLNPIECKDMFINFLNSSNFQTNHNRR